jgi:hypothetical protein
VVPLDFQLLPASYAGKPQQLAFKTSWYILQSDVGREWIRAASHGIFTVDFPVLLLVGQQQTRNGLRKYYAFEK